MGCPETSVRNYHYALRNNPEERSSRVDILFVIVVRKGKKVESAGLPHRTSLLRTLLQVLYWCKLHNDQLNDLHSSTNIGVNYIMISLMICIPQQILV